jgi:hypothetical protein
MNWPPGSSRPFSNKEKKRKAMCLTGIRFSSPGKEKCEVGKLLRNTRDSDSSTYKNLIVWVKLERDQAYRSMLCR